MDAKKRNSMQKISTVVGAIVLNHPLGYQHFTLAQRGVKLRDQVARIVVHSLSGAQYHLPLP
jgi:hypothetical protein